VLCRTSQRPAPPGKLASRIPEAGWSRNAPRPTSSAAAAAQARLGLAQQLLSEAIDETQAAFVVEREDGDLDLGHDLREKSSRFERPEPLLAKRLGERVDFQEHFAQRIVEPRAARPDGEVLLPHRREEVRHGLERTDHALPESLREEQPRENDEDGQRPANLR
jgi:hypothetical protein